MNCIENEIPFQHTQEGRLKAMCLWSPAEPRLLNQSAGCDRLTGREIERGWWCVFVIEENKRKKREEKLRQRDRLKIKQERKRQIKEM